MQPDCVLISAITENNAALLTKQIAAALPHVRIYGMAGLAESTFTDAAQGGIPPALDPRMMITVATLDPSLYPTAGRAFFGTYSRRYGAPQPYAIFGYEAMSLLLSAIDRATDHGRKTARRSKVVGALFSTHDRHSVLGAYGVTRTGDTTLRRYGVYRVLNGALTFVTAIQA
jgi:branched-chain amino acid transport system substrate-binding protein